MMVSFQAKIGWKRREREKIKIDIPFRSVPALRVIENSKKIPFWIQKLKIIAPFCSYSTRNRKFQKN